MFIMLTKLFRRFNRPTQKNNLTINTTMIENALVMWYTNTQLSGKYHFFETNVYLKPFLLLSAKSQGILSNIWVDLISLSIRNHSFGTFTTFSEKVTFLILWYEIRGQEMLSRNYFSSGKFWVGTKAMIL